MKQSFNDYFIKEDASMRDALSKLDKVVVKNLFVIEDGKLKASLTDGDIRRWMLKKGDLEANVKDFANYSSKYLNHNEKQSAHKLMSEEKIEALPIINDDGEIIEIIFADSYSAIARESLKGMPIVVMAGGLGTRLYPYTKILPKPLIPIGEIPISEHIINSFKKFGAREFFMILNHKKNMIKAYFNELEKDYSVEYFDEDKPLGTGGGLSLLKGKINSTFALTNCDILVDDDYGKIYEQHKNEGNIITMVCSIKNYQIPYGVVEVTENGGLDHMKEKPTFSFLTNAGVYIVEPRVIDELEEKKPIGFPDIIEKYKNLGEKVGIYPIAEESWMDMGQLDEMEDMIKRLGV